jgi:multiple sugar transport system substrate-binding protein
VAVGALRSRRSFLRDLSFASAGVRLLGAAVAVPASGRSARAERGSGPVVISWAPWGGWPSYGGGRWQSFMQPGIAHFESLNPGIKVQLVAPGGGGSFLPQILAGTAPDIIQDWAIGPYRNANAVVNLAPYLRQDNLPTTLWSPGQMHAMTDAQGVWFLPCYVHVTAMAVNYSILDALGLKHPTPDWTYEEAAALYRAASGVKNGQRVYGVAMYFTGADMGDPSSMSSYVFHFFGGRMVAPDRVHCDVGDPRSYQGVQWVEELHYDNVISPNERDNDLAHIAFCETGSNEMVTVLENWRDKFDWSFLPVPHFPNGQFSFEATDYHAIAASTRHPDEAWILLRFLAADPYWSRYAMKYLLRTPSLVSLWDEYARTIEAVAPVARGKNVQVYAQAAAEWGIANGIFRYQQPQVASIINTYLGKVYNRQATTAEAMPQAAQQVNALEASGALIAAANRRIDALLAGARQSAGAVTFPSPSVQGAGTPATPAAKGAFTVKNGVYTIVGTGANPLRGTDDGMTFACLPWTKSKGIFTCRLVAVSAVSGVTIPGNAKIGLMARGTLSSDAADAFVVVAMGHSVQFGSRPYPGTDMADQNAGSFSGMLGQSGLLGNLSAKLANYLLKPIWLRLVQDVNIWTAFASYDGRSWVAQGKAVGAEAAGVWVGLCVSPALPDTQHVQAVFDNLNFTPTAVYQIG